LLHMHFRAITGQPSNGIIGHNTPTSQTDKDRQTDR